MKTKLRAVEEVNQVLEIKLGVWLREPNKQRRLDVEEAAADHAEVLDRILGLDDAET
jgi:hypothetical protein